MKSYEWWLKQKQRIRKKYNLLCGKYLSPKETRDFVKRLKEKQNESCDCQRNREDADRLR